MCTGSDPPAPEHTSPTVSTPEADGAGYPGTTATAEPTHSECRRRGPSPRDRHLWAARRSQSLRGCASAYRVPAAIAWLYPLTTDGLTLVVAYAATTRLPVAAARYAWSVVVLVAPASPGSSSRHSLPDHDGRTDGACFRVGAWPSLAATPPTRPDVESRVQSAPFRPARLQPTRPLFNNTRSASLAEPVQSAGPTGVQPARSRPVPTTMSDGQTVGRSRPARRGPSTASRGRAC